MSTEQMVMAAYALLLFVGGFMGMKAGSRVSLIMGIVSGSLVLVGVYLLGVTPKTGYIFLAVINALLSVVFIKRYLATKKIMPSGMLLVLSLGVLVFCLVSLGKFNQTLVTI